MSPRPLLWSAGAVLALCGSAAAEEAPRKLSFTEAIQVALSTNPDVAIAKTAVDSSKAHTDGIKAKRLPSLRLDLISNLYTEPYELPFGDQIFTLHERLTSTSTASITQPLTGLAYLGELVDASRHETAAKEHEFDKVKLDIAYRAADAYLRLLEANANSAVAKQSVADIQSGLDRATELRKADVYTDIDVLRFKSAKASADLSVLRAQTAIDTATAELLHQLGLKDSSKIDVADDLPAAPPALVMTLEEAQTRALATRPDLGAARERIAEADNARRGAKEVQYFPDINAIAAAQYNTGVEPFQPQHEEYVGVRLSWEVWDWGAKGAKVTEAELAQKRSQLEAASLADQVRIDVRNKWLAAKTAFDSLAAAKVGQDAAEEALRLQKVKLDAAAATTTDVLDAETDAFRARLSFAIARYDYYLSLVSLARAIGDVPNPTH